jgi:hypothetical protein
MIKRLALSWSLLAAALTATEQCSLPDKAIRRLIHYQAWSHYWLEAWYEYRRAAGVTAVFEVPKNQDLKVLRDGAAWLVYSLPYQTVYRISDSGVSSSTCWHLRDWMKCLADNRVPMLPPSLSDILLGKMRPAGPFDPREICTFALTVPPGLGEWNPSEESGPKQQLMRLLRDEVRRALKYFPTIQRITCNNFNLDDPRVWAIVDVIDPAGIADRLLVGVEIGHGEPIRVGVSTVHSVGSEHAPLVERILRDPLELSQDNE